MRTLRALWMRLVRAGRADREFEAELESHIRMHTEDGVRSGLSEDEARRQALIRLGHAEQARQAYRERAGLPLLDTHDAGRAVCAARLSAQSCFRDDGDCDAGAWYRRIDGGVQCRGPHSVSAAAVCP